MSQAFVSYLRSIHVQKDKSVFQLDKLPLQRYAESLGLPGAPKIKFLNKEIAKLKKNASHATTNLAKSGKAVSDESDGSASEDDEGMEDTNVADLSEHSSSEEEEAQPQKPADAKVIGLSPYLDVLISS